MRRVPPQVYPRPNMDYQSQGYQLGQQFGQPMQPQGFGQMPQGYAPQGFGQYQPQLPQPSFQRPSLGFGAPQFGMNYGGGSNQFDETNGMRRQPRQFPNMGLWGG